MFGLLKRDLVSACAMPLIISSLIMLFGSWGMNVGDPTMALVAAFSIAATSCGTVLAIEHWEDKHEGYALLRSLPLGVREIVAAKFIISAAAVSLVSTFWTLFFQMFAVSGFATGPVVPWIVLSISCTLMLTGIIYTGVYAFGYGAFLRYFLAFLLLLVMATLILLFNSDSGNGPQETGDWYPMIGSIDTTLILAVSLAAYILLFPIATMLNDRSRTR